MADKYPTAELIGVVVQQNNDGGYKPQKWPLTLSDFHSWRIGKHTKGKLADVGQLFLTENGLTVMLVAVNELVFKKRHTITPMGRFLTVKIDAAVLADVVATYTQLQSN